MVINFVYIFEIFLRVTFLLGGFGFVFWKLSSYLADLFAKRIIEKYKTGLEKEVEKYKTELEKIKDDYKRFSTKKFEIIEQTWSTVFEIKEKMKIYRNDDVGGYNYYLEEELKAMTRYFLVIQKNSLYFNGELVGLLNRYITLSSELVHGASAKVLDVSSESDIMQHIINTSQEREDLIEKIKNKLKDELGNFS